MVCNLLDHTDRLYRPTGARRAVHSTALPVRRSVRGHDINNNKKGADMFKEKKIRQATVILIAVAIVLILPNLDRLVG